MALTPAVVSVDSSGPNFDIAYTSYTAPDAFVYYRKNNMPKSADPQAQAEALAILLAPQVEAEEGLREKEAAVAAMYVGTDPHTITYHIITIEEMRTFALRTLSNLTGSYENTVLGEHIEEVINANVALVQVMDTVYGVSNNAFSAYFANSNTGQVTGWRGWMDGITSSVNTYVQGIEVQELS